MTPYRERREQGFYNPTGEATKSTTTGNLSGLGAPQSEPAPENDLENFTKNELLARARAQGISPANAAMSKAELIEALSQ